MPLLNPMQEDEDWLKRASDSFVGRPVDPLDTLFSEEDEEEQTPSIWEQSDWWMGETTEDKHVSQEPFKVQQETQEHATEQGVDPWAQSEQKTQNAFTEKRWFAKFDNGEIPESALVSIGGGHAMRPDAATAFKAMRRAAKKQGITLGVTDSYRTYDQQVDLKARKPTLAATPGKSNHGWGIALDLNVNSEDAYRWLARNGKNYGYSQPMDYEPWHWEYHGGYKGARKTPVQKQTMSTTVQKPAKEVGASDLGSKATPFGDGMTFRDAVVAFATEPMRTRSPRQRATTRLMVDGTPETPEEARRLGKKMAAAYGWTDAQWDALNELIGGRESGWNYKADNPESTAIGIPQRLESAHPFPNKRARQKWLNDPVLQIRWLLSYVDQRYGSPRAALAHSTAEGWY